MLQCYIRDIARIDLHQKVNKPALTKHPQPPIYVTDVLGITYHKHVNLRQAECHKCHKKGHIAKACKTRQGCHVTEQGKATKKGHYVEESLEPIEQTVTDNTYNLFTVAGSGQNPIVLKVTVNNLPIQMELDTGASLSLLNQQT